ncbi:MAG TPA: hypothetical protein VGB81_01545 [Devosia sp.]|jgi:hypothetical protein
MTDRTRQLLLELLLIRERYSSQEIQRLLSAVTEGMFDEEVKEVLQLLDRIPKSRPARASRAKPSSFNAQEAREKFLRIIRMPETSAETRRLKNVARRLGLDNARSNAELVERVRSEVNRLEEKELRAFLRPYRLDEAPDEGYIGLANFLMHNK